MSTWTSLSRLAAQWLAAGQLRIMQLLTVRCCPGTMLLSGLITRQAR